MKRKAVTVMMGLALAAMTLAGCGAGGAQDGGSAQPAAQETAAADETADEEQEEASETEKAPEAAQTEAAEATAGSEETEGDEETYEAVDVRVGSLKGPTSMGLVYLMDQADKGEAANHYEFTMAAAADELLPASSTCSLA